MNDGVPRIGVSPNLTVGGFACDALTGVGSFSVSPRVKQRHKGSVVACHVVPEWRGSGLAAFLDRLIAEARGAGPRGSTLSVTSDNEPARLLYRRAGFVTYGGGTGGPAGRWRLLDEELMALRL